jgi:hypothetical protein
VVLVRIFVRQKASQTILANPYGVSQATMSRSYRPLVPLLAQVLRLNQN